MKGIWLKSGEEFEYPVITNSCIYDMGESVVASSYPMLKLYQPLQDDLYNSEYGERDLKRATRLAIAPAGSGHDCFLKGIVVSFDLTLSLKCWTEAERYTFLNFVSSMSSLKLAETDAHIAFVEYTDPDAIHILDSRMKVYQRNKTKDNWLRMVYSMPTGLLLSARMTTNYMQLKTIHNQRRAHRLPEWQEFCDWIETLPHSEWITSQGWITLQGVN